MHGFSTACVPQAERFVAPLLDGLCCDEQLIDPHLSPNRSCKARRSPPLAGGPSSNTSSRCTFRHTALSIELFTRRVFGKLFPYRRKRCLWLAKVPILKALRKLIQLCARRVQEAEKARNMPRRPKLVHWTLKRALHALVFLPFTIALVHITWPVRGHHQMVQAQLHLCPLLPGHRHAESCELDFEVVWTTPLVALAMHVVTSSAIVRPPNRS